MSQIVMLPYPIQLSFIAGSVFRTFIFHIHNTWFERCCPIHVTDSMAASPRRGFFRQSQCTNFDSVDGQTRQNLYLYYAAVNEAAFPYTNWLIIMPWVQSRLISYNTMTIASLKTNKQKTTKNRTKQTKNSTHVDEGLVIVS